MQIAIDGSAASGKTTIAKILARQLGLVYLDTGAMYRAVAWRAQVQGIALSDERAVSDLAERLPLRIEPSPQGCRLLLEQVDVTDHLYQPEVSQVVALVASYPGVRRALVKLQREHAASLDVVMVGRDIGSVVLPDAEVKVFLTANLKERARRRWQELEGCQSLEVVEQELKERDACDRNRTDSPLVCAPDALTIDSTSATPQEIAQRIAEVVETRRART